MKTLSKPLFIKDKSVVGVLLPNTKDFSKALKDFIAGLKLEKEFREWDKELETPEARKRIKSIIADADANDGWIGGEEFFEDLKKSRLSEI